MSTSSAQLPSRTLGGGQRGSFVANARAYFASDGARIAQTVLGLIWLLDGGLQFQSFMYSKGFLALLTGSAPGQPGWLHDSINWGAHLASHNLDVYNTLFALVQCVIGIGLLYRPSVKAALLLSFGWALVVWWFGEGFGMLFMGMGSPLTGAPGGVIMYALVGLVVWPGRPGGLLGVQRARMLWGGLWLLMAYLWLLAPSSSANAVSSSLTSTDSGMGWLTSFQNTVAGWTRGDGLVIALVCAALSAAIGIAVAKNWRPKPFLAAAALLNLVLWVLPQGFGGMFAGGATDPNAAPLFILLAYALYTLVPKGGTSQIPTESSVAG
jgi:hypothetical protein